MLTLMSFLSRFIPMRATLMPPLFGADAAFLARCLFHAANSAAPLRHFYAMPHAAAPYMPTATDTPRTSPHAIMLLTLMLRQLLCHADTLYAAAARCALYRLLAIMSAARYLRRHYDAALMIRALILFTR